MSRSTKKILYGIFWNGLILLVILIVYLAWWKPVPSCTDGVKNQAETGVDCGGSCASCLERQASPLEVFEEPRTFSLTSGRAVVIGQVANPNTVFGATEFSYEFVIRDQNAKVIERLPGLSMLYPFETRYLANFSAMTPAQKIASVSLEVRSPQWRPAGEMPRPDLQLRSGVTTTISGDSIRVQGAIRNLSDAYVEKVRIFAILVDRSGNDLFPAQTVISGLSGFRELPFVVQFPPDEALVDAADSAATRVIIQAE